MPNVISPSTVVASIAAAGAIATAGVAWASITPMNQLWGKVYSRANGRGSSGYALSFDDGPTEPFTDVILDILAEHHAPAAFFVIGENVRQYPRLIQRMHAEGHLIANHSLTHWHYGLFRGCAYWNREIRRTDALIDEIIGQRPAFFRPPMGIKTFFNSRSARMNGQAVVTWNRRALDGLLTTPQRILDRLAEQVRAGDIVMMHDGIEPNGKRDPSATITALRPLIQRLTHRKLQPVRLDQLLGLPGYLRSEEPHAAQGKC